MFFANDYHDSRVHIDDTQSNQEYYCPYCGEQLITRKGDIRAHHFAHKQNSRCSDSWEREHTYDMSPWHNEWQSLFPRENQEIKLALGDTKHRADVLIGRTVVEFQHSAMNAANFDNRNNFYFNLGYKVVWLFDLSDLVQAGRMTWREDGDILRFDWNNPQKTFNAYDVQSGCIDLFFQLSETEEKCIVMVRDVSPQGFEHFSASDLMSKDEFLSYLGMTDGCCPAPICDEEQNEAYIAFKEKYGINLNKQQERALLAVEGAVLLLAVPGSGKTTVLVDRLGYMTHVKHIPPEQILAVTFGKKAAGEMKTRFSAKYGKDIAEKISFQTINSLSLRIYTQFCYTVGKAYRTIEEDGLKVLRDIYGKYYEKYPPEEDIVNLSSALGYVKNMMRDKDIAEYDEEYPHFSDIYRDYQETLDKNQRMDFDDQMVYAEAILKKRPEVLAQWRNRFKYILVDEAQDTSKIQHEIIRMLAEGNNLFMVGDEDQSIYGFRGSFPKAMLNFRYDYKNPYILRMERNYRSTPEIVDKAQQFISQNKGRYEKHMTAVREPGGSFICEQVDSVKAQYDRLLEVALHRETQTAFLYRDNESAVILVDRFLRNNIDFILRAPNFNFFSCRIVREIKAYLTIAIDPYNAEMLNIICKKGILFLKPNPLKYAVSNSKQRHITVYDALEEQMEYVKEHKDRASKFKTIMERVAKLGPVDAIQQLMAAGYINKVNERGDVGRLDVLTYLAGQEPDIPAFLKRLEYLEQAFTKGFTAQTSDPVILSTIHTAKGLEYDTVYMVDVYDGRFPSYKPDPFYRSKDNADPGQEERRLFYVGITRAKNKLVVMSINGRPSSFIDELFPEIREQREKEQLEKERKEREQKEKERRDWEEREKALRILEQLAKEKAERERKEQEEREREQRNKEAAERYWARKAAEDEERKRQYLEEQTKRQQQQGTPHKDEILPLIDTDTLAVDSTGNRWVKCTVCGKISPSCVFAFVGEDAAHPNYGRCNACTGKRTR